MLPIYLIALSFGMPTNPMSAYLTLQVRDIGFDTFITNLLTIPAYVLFIGQLLFWTWVSERWNQRFLVGLSSQIWALPLLLFLEYMPADTGHWIKYAITVLLVGHPYVHAILVAITSRNAGTVRTRTVASALYNMFCQASSIISQNVRSTPCILNYDTLSFKMTDMGWLANGDGSSTATMIDRSIDGATRFSSLSAFTTSFFLLERNYSTSV